MMLKFFYNGIKDSTGRLHKAWYSYSETRNNGMTLTVYSADHTCSRFASEEIGGAFTVENDTDTMTDYFRPDSITIPKDHKYFRAAISATIKQEEKRVRRLQKQLLKCKAYMIPSLERDISNRLGQILKLQTLLKEEK